MGQADGVWIVDEGTQQAVPGGQLTDRRGELVRDADVDELLQIAVGRDDTQRAVAGSDEVDGDVNDAAEHGGEVELFDDGLAGLEQAAQSPLGGEHLLGVQDEFGQRLVKC